MPQVLVEVFPASRQDLGMPGVDAQRLRRPSEMEDGQLEGSRRITRTQSGFPPLISGRKESPLMLENLTPEAIAVILSVWTWICISLGYGIGRIEERREP